MAQFGHRSYDFDRILGDLYERSAFRNHDVVMPVMQAVISGYGAVGEDMALRTAIYVDVHLITWYQRRPKIETAVDTKKKSIGKGLAMGRDFVLKDWAKDTQFFQDTHVSSLFA